MTAAQRVINLARRVWRYVPIFAFLWVLLVAVVPAVAHRDAFPTVALDSYAEPSAIDCGWWPDADCVKRRDAYANHWALAQRDDFIEALASDFESVGTPQAAQLATELVDPSNGLARPSARQCFAGAYLASAYRHAQNAGLTDAFRAFIRLALSVPKANPVSKIPLRSGKALAHPSGAITGFNDDRYLANLRQGMAVCA